MSIVEITVFGTDGVPRRHLDLALEDVALNVGADEAAAPGHHDLDRARLIDGEVVVLPPELPSPEALLAKARASAAVAVNRATADTRLAHVTALPMQDGIYQRKMEEAGRWIADPAPDLALYPFIAGRAKATGKTPQAVAEEFAAKAHAWERIGAATDAVRDAHTVAIGAAETPEQVAIARDTALADLALLADPDTAVALAAAVTILTAE